VPLLAEIFRASIEELTMDDYSPAQQEVWAAVADDEEAFGTKLAGELTLVCTLNGSPIGFGALADTQPYRHALTCTRPRQGRGCHYALCALEKPRRPARGAKELTVDLPRYGRALFSRSAAFAVSA